MMIDTQKLKATAFMKIEKMLESITNFTKTHNTMN
jgi:hypothetical protein